MQCASTSTYPENLGRGVYSPRSQEAEFVRFLFVCPSRYVASHRKPRRFVYALNSGGTGISLPDSFSYRSNFRFRSSFRSRSRSSSTTSGDIFYCSGSRQLNHSSYSYSKHRDVISMKWHSTVVTLGLQQLQDNENQRFSINVRLEQSTSLFRLIIRPL